MKYDRLRFAVLFRTLEKGFGQRESEVLGLLRQEVLGQTGGGRPASDNVPTDDGLTEDAVPELADGRPLAELVVIAIDELERPEHWGALAAEPRTQPIGWLARRLIWRVRDRIRNHERARPRTAQPREHHRLSAWLEILAEADPDLGGPVSGLRGLYRSVLRQVAEHLSRADDLGAAFALRKLFPPHAWPPEDPGGRGIVAGDLLARLHRRFAPGDWAAVAREIASCWGGSPTPDVRAGLDASADHHLRADSFPGLTEVGLWCGPDPWLSRKISRLGAEIEPLVEAALERVRAELA